MGGLFGVGLMYEYIAKSPRHNKKILNKYEYFTFSFPKLRWIVQVNMPSCCSCAMVPWMLFRGPCRMSIIALQRIALE
jgi:hypothetical protein